MGLHLRIPGVAELVGEVAARRIEAGGDAGSGTTIVVVLEGIVKAVRALLAEVEGRVEELSALGDLEAGDDSQELKIIKVSYSLEYLRDKTRLYYRAWQRARSSNEI